jgi:hypothetical protein
VQSTEENKLTIDFSATDDIQLFGEGIISNSHYSRDLAISPNGEEIFYTSVSPRNKFSTIIHLKKSGNTWIQAQIASFSGQYSDLEPFIHPNGKQLFFASNRPVDTGETVKDFDIWFVEKDAQGQWTSPNRLPENINTVTDEFYPSIANSGNLYFTASYDDAKGREDIYKSTWDGSKFSDPVSLDSVNSAFFEFNAFIAPDESYLIYSSFGREDGLGRGDLYISFNENEIWTPGKNLAEPINSSYLDYCPFVDSNLGVLYFTSERHDIPETQADPLNFQQWQDLLNKPENGSGNVYKIKFEPDKHR